VTSHAARRTSTAQIEHDRSFVAGIGLPKQFVATVVLLAQRKAGRRLDLDHVGAKIG
jgi:hypothetical protein